MTTIATTVVRNGVDLIVTRVSEIQYLHANFSNSTLCSNH